VCHDSHSLLESERRFIFDGTGFIVYFEAFEDEYLLIWCEEFGVFWEWDDEEESDYAEEGRSETFDDENLTRC
jgi:hypothetical protein